MRKIALLLACALPALAQQPPDLLIVNAKVYTGDPAKPAEAIAIREGRIVGVGTTEEIISMAPAKTRTIDAKKHLVVPGFNDAHTHQMPTPAERFVLGLKDDPSREDLQLALNNATEETPEGPWITGTIGTKILLDPQVNAAWLDKVSHNRKVILQAFSGHGIIASSAALQALRVSGASDPMGGWFERDAGGRLTGKAFEYADDLVLRKLSETISDDDAAEQLRPYVDNALKHGVTSIQNMSYFPTMHQDKILRHNAFPLRIRVIRFPGTSANGPDFSDAGSLPVTSRERPLQTVMGTKWILDGTPLEQFAATRTNYPNTSANGRLNFTPEQLKTIAKAAFDSPQQTLFHVAGDRTTAELFDAMRAVAPPEQWRAKRIRIEHGDGLLPDLIPVAKDFGVVVVVNPSHFAAKGLYPKGAYLPLRSLLKAGIPVAMGSDEPIDPFGDIAAATAHPDPAESITRAEAVDLYTRGSAYAEFAENDKGTIANGKFADVAVLSNDILDHGDLGSTVSLMTIVNGEIVYDAGLLQVKRADDIRK
jgi:hypothetical protein